MTWLINAAQADKFRKSQKSLIILDATLHPHYLQRDPKAEFIAKHIIDAQFFDIDDFSDPTSPLPHTLLRDEKLISEKLSALGIRNDYKIIIYDNSELHSAFRAIWMLKMFGHNPQQLYILDGGWQAWEKYGGKTSTGTTTFTAKTYTAEFQPQFLRTLAQMKENVLRPREQVVDLRHPIRFAGGKEPREGVRRGHIPGSFSIPFTTLFDKNGNLLTPEKIRKELQSVAIDFKSPIITTCGSGISAAILDTVLDLLNHKQHALYDGSWSEWGSETLFAGETSLNERPIETCIDEDEPTPANC